MVTKELIKWQKKGKNSPSLWMPDYPDLSRATVNIEIEKAIRALWRAMWSDDPSCRQTKMWFPDGPG